MRNRISECIKKSADNFNTILTDENLKQTIEQIVGICIVAFRNDKKVLLCGNGGSASDAQHIAAELSGRFYKDRKPLYAEALHVNSSFITAVANDYGYDKIFERQCESLVKEGDVVLAISTSGTSKNVILGAKMAKKNGAKVISLTGSRETQLTKISDISIRVPSSSIPRIQEVHRLILHLICSAVEHNY